MSTPITPLASGDPTLAPAVITLEVYGEPATQGSKRAWVNAKTGRAQMIEQTSDRLIPWRSAVTTFARRAMEISGTNERRAPLDGPLAARMVFTVRKPLSAPKTRRTWPHKGKDVSKLARAAEDALTAAGLWVDDSRVVEYERLAKVYPGEDPEALDVPGVRITVWQVA